MGRHHRSRSRSRERSRRRRSRSRSRSRDRATTRRERDYDKPKREIKEEEIKTEEEFDRRQDDARKRRANHVAGRREGFKQERESSQAPGSSNPFANELRNAGEWGKADEEGEK